MHLRLGGRAVALLLAGLAACAPTGRRGTAVEYYFSADPRALDPALSTEVVTGEVVALLYDNLTQFDADARVQPGLATHWEATPDGRTWTFHLRRGVTFHDGSAFRARHVEASFRRLLAPATQGRAWPLFPVVGARALNRGEATDLPGLAVLDDSTVRFTLEEPLNVFPKLLAMPATAIVPDPAPPTLAVQPVGSGPWRFVRWSRDDVLTLARHAGYWGRVPASDTLHIRIIPEPLTQAAEFESGRLSVVEVPFGETRRWERDAQGAALLRRPALRALYVALNTRRGILQDVRVRQAINHAVDVQALLTFVAAGRGVRAAGAVPPGLPGHDGTRRPYAHDPARARRLLAAAGVPAGAPLRLWRSKRPEFARISAAIQQDLGRVGLAVEIVERDPSSARAAVRNGEADLYLADWYADYPDAENFSYPLFFSRNAGAGGNYAFLDDPGLDTLILAARATPDTARAAALARAVDARVLALAPWLFLWFPVDLWAVRGDFAGWTVPLVFNGQRWQEARWVR